MEVILGEEWKKAFPQAGVGIMVITDLVNPKSDAETDKAKRALEADLRQRFQISGKEAIRALPVMQAYGNHYKKFEKNYHVQLQTESVALQGKDLQSVSALVDTMFLAELKNGLLTAGHDLNAVQPPLKIDAAIGDQTYTLMNGNQQTLKSGDMCMSDSEGVISSVLSGPDARTRITRATKAALFVVYAPEGIQPSAVLDHLAEIQRGVTRFSPAARTVLFEVLGF